MDFMRENTNWINQEQINSLASQLKQVLVGQ